MTELVYLADRHPIWCTIWVVIVAWAWAAKGPFLITRFYKDKP